MNPDDEQIPYRGPVTAPKRDVATDNDDQDYSTLVEVKKTFDSAIEDLYKDFNAFEILKSDTTEEQKNKLITLIIGKQIAYDILVPLQSTIHSAIEAVNRKRKGN